MSQRQLLAALGAAAVALALGSVRHRAHRWGRAFALIEAAEWFIAAGGATALLRSARRALEELAGPEAPEVERITRVRQSVTEEPAARR